MQLGLNGQSFGLYRQVAALSLPQLCPKYLNMDQSVDRRILLSSLWIYILINIIFRDIHQMTLKSHLEMLLTGYYHGQKVTDLIILIGGIVLEIPILMIVLARVLKQRYNRPLNLWAAVITFALIQYEMPSDMDDYFFRILESLALVVIFWKSWTWKQE